MMRSYSIASLARYPFVWALLALVLFAGPAEAVNRFRVVGDDLALSSAGNTVFVEADLDQATYGFSVSLNYNPAMIRIVSVSLGADVAALTPEYSAGVIDNTAGQMVHGVVFALSAGNINVNLAAGTGRRILELEVDVLATQEGTTVIDLVNVNGDPGRRNVMTNVNGNSVSPDPALQDGTLNLTEIGPVIESILPNRGEAGVQILISGRNFDEPNLVVRLCGQVVADAEVIGLGGGTITLSAPPCGVAGPSTLEVCTDFGCAQGTFTYDQVVEGTPFIRGNANGDASVDLSDAVSIFADLFLGNSAAAACRDALDVNDSGLVDISDGISLLNFLFQGGTAPPPPFPAAGLDPTPDSIPSC